MAASTNESREPYVTEDLIRDPAIQASLGVTFGTINETYDRLREEGKQVTPLAAFALLKSGILIEVAEAKVADKTYVDPEDYVVHYIDLRGLDGVIVTRANVIESVPLRSGDVVLTVEDQDAQASMVGLPGYASKARGNGVSYTPDAYASLAESQRVKEPIEPLWELRQRLNIPVLEP